MEGESLTYSWRLFSDCSTHAVAVHMSRAIFSWILGLRLISKTVLPTPFKKAGWDNFIYGKLWESSNKAERDGSGLGPQQHGPRGWVRRIIMSSSSSCFKNQNSKTLLKARGESGLRALLLFQKTWLHSQHPCGGSQLSVTPFSGLQGMHVVHRHTSRWNSSIQPNSPHAPTQAPTKTKGQKRKFFSELLLYCPFHIYLRKQQFLAIYIIFS